MKFIIRETVEGDYPQVRHLLESLGLAGDSFTLRLFRRLLRRNEGCCFVGEVKASGRFAGCVFGTHDGGYAGYIFKLAVDPEYQRQKLGSSLIRAVVEAFNQLGVNWHYAHVRKSNEASIALFESAGFKIRDTHHLIDDH